MSPKMMVAGLGGLSVWLVLASAHFAAAAGQGSEEDRRACTPDVFRLCGEFIPDAARITICLQQKMRLLSPQCRAVITRSAKR